MSQDASLLRARLAALVVALVVCVLPLAAQDASSCADDCHDTAMEIYQDHGETGGAYDLANHVWEHCIAEC